MEMNDDFEGALEDVPAAEGDDALSQEDSAGERLDQAMGDVGDQVTRCMELHGCDCLLPPWACPRETCCAVQGGLRRRAAGPGHGRCGRPGELICEALQLGQRGALCRISRLNSAYRHSR